MHQPPSRAATNLSPANATSATWRADFTTTSIPRTTPARDARAASATIVPAIRVFDMTYPANIAIAWIIVLVVGLLYSGTGPKIAPPQAPCALVAAYCQQESPWTRY